MIIFIANKAILCSIIINLYLDICFLINRVYIKSNNSFSYIFSNNAYIRQTKQWNISLIKNSSIILNWFCWKEYYFLVISYLFVYYILEIIADKQLNWSAEISCNIVVVFV